MTAATVLQPYDQHTGALTLVQAQHQYNALVEFTKSVLKDGLDYGKVPGVQKPSLLKPGAEKLATLYRLRPSFELVTSREDWDGGFFYYHYRCKLTRDGEFMGEAEGSCNTKEKKYRYRNADRLCPSCGQPQIRKSKEEWGGGYYCNQKSGGCGAKFAKGSAEFKAIEAQEVGQVENPDIYDVVNTVQKMAQKRALVAAVLITTGASEFFTQDVEDLQVVHVDYAVVQEPKPLSASTTPTQQQRQQTDITQEVKQAVRPEPEQPATVPPNDVALERVRDMASRVRKYGALAVDTILSNYHWETDMEACKQAYSALMDFGKQHAAQEPAPALQPEQPPQEDGRAIAIARKLGEAPYSFKSTERTERLAFLAWLSNANRTLASTKDLTSEELDRALKFLNDPRTDGAELLERWNVSRQPQQPAPTPPARPNRVGTEPVIDAEFSELPSLSDDELPF